MNTLILTEKPSVAGDFAKAFGATREKGYYVVGDTVITWCIGHLLELYEPEDYAPEYKKWALEALPIIPEKFRYKPKDKTKAQLAIIGRLLAQKPARIIVATDAGREGELIARTVLRHAGLTDFSQVLRFWSSEALTPEVIKRNVGELKPISAFDPLYQAGVARQFADWICGYNFTRLLSLKMDATFPFGRVQTAVLRFIAERDEQIRNFHPVDRFELSLTARKADKGFRVIFTEGKSSLFPDRVRLDEISKRFAGVPVTGKVITCERNEKKESAPRLYNLSALQQDANKRLRLTASQTLAAAQSLYEKYKCLSYPRTPSRVLPRSAHALFSQAVHLLSTQFPAYFGASKMPEVSERRIFCDEELVDHHALIALAIPSSDLSPAEAAVYDLVVRSMAASISPVHRVAVTTVLVDSEGLLFRASGTTVIDPGWKAAYRGSKKVEDDEVSSDHDESQPLPDLKEGEKVLLSGPVVKAKPTKPPHAYTDAAILSAMEHHNLGTEATRAGILEKLLDGGYTEREKRQLRVTDKGIHLISGIDSLSDPVLSCFTTPEETSRWESELELHPVQFLNDLTRFIRSSFGALKEVELARYHKRTVGNCLICASPLAESRKSYYCTRAREGCSFIIWKEVASHTLTETEVRALLAGKSTHPVTLKDRSGKSFRARLVYSAKDNRVLFESVQQHALTSHSKE